MRNLQDIKQILQEHKEALYREYGVTEIGLFGSYVKDAQAQTSDVDILVSFQKAIDLLMFVRLKNYLSELLEVEVDLVMKKSLKPKIGERILREVVYV